jgi:hypothetical protein
MTEHSPVSIDDVRALVAERHRFDDWLSALESRRAETPEHVYARVHGDYLTRRERVLAQLHAQAPALSELLASLDARSDSLSARMGAQEDERTEAMLRHAVGEFDDAAWHAVRDRVEASLQEMGVEHTVNSRRSVRMCDSCCPRRSHPSRRGAGGPRAGTGGAARGRRRKPRRG